MLIAVVLVQKKACTISDELFSTTGDSIDVPTSGQRESSRCSGNQFVCGVKEAKIERRNQGRLQMLALGCCDGTPDVVPSKSKGLIINITLF